MSGSQNEFVDMSEVSTCEELVWSPGQAPLPAEPPVTDISVAGKIFN